MKRKRASVGSAPAKKMAMVKQPQAQFKPVRRQGAAVGAALAPELKFFDTAFNTDASTTGTIVSLNNMAAGDTALTRDGNKILCKSLNLRIAIQNESLTISSTVRVLVVVDKNANNANPSFATAGTGVLEAITPESQRRIDSISRFHCLMDETIVINAESGTGGAESKAFIERFIRIPEEFQLSQYLDGSAGVPVSNSLTLLYLSDQVSGVSDVNFVGTCRLRFIG